MNIDFRSYHVRAMNAQSEEEKAAINAELKALYEALPDAEKPAFNKALEEFLVKQYAAISSLYNEAKDTHTQN